MSVEYNYPSTEELTSTIKERLPRRVANALVQVCGSHINVGNVWVLFSVRGRFRLIYFHYSDNFPTDLDIARMCVETI